MEGAARARDRAARRGHRRAGRRARRHHADHPARSGGAAGGRLSALRREGRRRTRALAARRPGAQGARDRLHAGRAVRAVSEPQPARVGGRRAVPARPDAWRSRGSRRCCRRGCGSSSTPCRACSPPSPAARAAGGEAQADRHGAAARRHAAPSRRHDALPLGVERPREGLPDPPLPHRLRAGRALPARVRPRVRRRPHLRREPHRGGLAREADLHAAQGSGRRRVRQFARRLLGADGAGRDRVRGADRALRPRPRLAPVAGSKGGRRRDACDLSMRVCHDWALRSWILGWGPLARVLAPASLANEIQSDLQSASTRYASPGS